MVIGAQDGGGLAAPESARVNISVVAGSVAPPMFERAQYHFTVPEDALRGTQVGGVRASGSIGVFTAAQDRLLFLIVYFGHLKSGLPFC